LPAIAQQTWGWYRVNLDLTPPLLVITNPASSNVMQPMIEVQGFCPEALARLTYDLSNAAGFFPNQQAIVLNRNYDTNTWEFTTNTFQAFDVALTNGDNVLTFHAADLAGNLTTTNFTFTLSYAARTNPPVVQLYWPQDGTQISGNTFTVRGWVDDFTTSLQATILDTNGDTNTVSAIVERDGKFWAGNLPLAAGTNQLTLTAIDAAGNVTTTNITVTGSPVALTMNAVDSSQLWQFTANVGGNISDPTYSVWVNGVQGTNIGDGTWSADNVPINAGGTAVFQVRAIASSDNGGNGSGGGATASYANLGNPASATACDMETDEDKPDRLYVSQYTRDVSQSENVKDTTVSYLAGAALTNIVAWTSKDSGNYTWKDQAGGSGDWNDTYNNGVCVCTNCSGQENWPATFWPDEAAGIQNFSGCCNPELDTNIGGPVIPFEHCDVNAPTNYNFGPGWGAFFNEQGEFFDSEWGWDNTTYIRKAQTTVHFDAGGKSVPGQDIYLITVSALDMLSTNPVPLETITIAGLGNLDTNGNLYALEPASGDFDVTPQAPDLQYYIFNVSVQHFYSYFYVYDRQPITPVQPIQSLSGWQIYEIMYDPGHVWWMFGNTAPPNNLIPSNLTPFLNTSAGLFNVGYSYSDPYQTYPGILRVPDPDNNQTVWTRWMISFDQLISGLQFTQGQFNHPPNYNLLRYNCVDEAIQAGAAAGVSVPDNKGGLDMSNPEYFGAGLPPPQ
jgi:hypothetical protein